MQNELQSSFRRVRQVISKSRKTLKHIKGKNHAPKRSPRGTVIIWRCLLHIYQNHRQKKQQQWQNTRKMRKQQTVCKISMSEVQVRWWFTIWTAESQPPVDSESQPEPEPPSEPRESIEESKFEKLILKGRVPLKEETWLEYFTFDETPINQSFEETLFDELPSFYNFKYLPNDIGWLFAGWRCFTTWWWWEYTMHAIFKEVQSKETWAEVGKEKKANWRGFI